jgi:hypothetical protein
MATPRYTLTHHPIETLLTRVKTAEITIPAHAAFPDRRRRLRAAKIVLSLLAKCRDVED